MRIANVIASGTTLLATGGSWAESFFGPAAGTITVEGGASLETNVHSLGGLGAAHEVGVDRLQRQSPLADCFGDHLVQHRRAHQHDVGAAPVAISDAELVLRISVTLLGRGLVERQGVRASVRVAERGQTAGVEHRERALQADEYYVLARSYMGQALIEQGTEIPYQQATSSGATSVSWKQ